MYADNSMCDRSEIKEGKDQFYTCDDLAKLIIDWKIKNNFAPKAYKTLDPLPFHFDQESKSTHNPVILSVATNGQSLMPNKGSHSGLHPGEEKLKGNSSLQFCFYFYFQLYSLPCIWF